MQAEKADRSSAFTLLIYLGWILINAAGPQINRLYDFRKINVYVVPAISMTLMLLLAWGYIRVYERRSFPEGFNFRFSQIGKNVGWALVFLAVAGVVLMGYQLLVGPLTSVLRYSRKVRGFGSASGRAARYADRSQILTTTALSRSRHGIDSQKRFQQAGCCGRSGYGYVHVTRTLHTWLCSTCGGTQKAAPQLCLHLLRPA